MELNRIYQMDVLDGVKLVADNSVDLVVTDPPYLMNYRSNRRVVRNKFDYIHNDQSSYDLIATFIDECYRVMKDNTAIYMFCSWHHIDYFKQQFERKFKLKNLIVWNKNNHGSGDLKGAYAPKHELILFGHKGRSLLQHKRIPDVIDCDKIPSAKLTHPTEKPVELLTIFILNSSQPGDVVLDGFIGTGATAVACVNTGRNFIGFETEPQYIEIANKRLEGLL
ncbi:DNA-methyltransferase [Alicyclobacillus acidoterrestris]|uniref:Methyltransferase n=1 Tax=Alicyclobacillus acidoterrestris (strain ATCC 49025 / DSM 3922 / CIP 106132 / NCIMB 13137 / GD3B) TaxID=1356854 RepID=A0A9E7CYU4_ALIAG|nr:site-specific DNA-methyltransferase [Alicyclobacillus acidoterrestris]UNO47932.1 site-specific DNA-methyltransferase [Alicyclobacillus acidoterrestris]